MRSLLCGVVAAFFLSVAAPAQVGTEGAILGVVRDSSGAVIPGVEVTATNLDTGIKKTALSDSGGNFEILPLTKGFYSVTASLAGFKVWTVEKTELILGERKRVSPTLEVGQLSEKVTVEATSTELVQTEKGSVETVIEAKAIRELPLNGRNPTQLVGLVPGMRVTSLASGLWRENTVQGLGQRTDQVEWQLDGVSSMEHADKSGIAFPSVETISEFNVETSNFTAEHGGQPLQVLMALKTGSNRFFASAWEFVQNDKLNARNTFATSKPKLRQNQFGFTLGGPIIKEKTFFFGSWEMTRIRKETVYNSFTVAPEMLKGDFSSLSKQVIDPLNGQRFPDNKIPDSRISSASKAFLSYILVPNSAGQLFRGVAAAPDDLGNYSWRVDHHLSQTQKIFWRGVINDNTVRRATCCSTTRLSRTTGT
ncbi:MAG: hypothetical protein DMG07_28135 [Acidobacteria bacterium]|nr:MAG: hypothetical protein DMG07_28135 [Acidobacteriota bacterium]